MAGSRTYRTKVLVLDKTKLKETDLILTMLDERGRQVRAVAKGARKPGGRLAARCELFCTVDMLLAHGRSLDSRLACRADHAFHAVASRYCLAHVLKRGATFSRAASSTERVSPSTCQLALSIGIGSQPWLVSPTMS